MAGNMLNMPAAAAYDPMMKYNDTGMGCFAGQEDVPLYGASFKPTKTAFVRGQRRSMNIVAMLLSLFIPWALFTATYAVMSFKVHYENPPVCYGVVFLCACVVFAFGVISADSWRKKYKGDLHREPTWFIFLFFSSLLGWGAACLFGDFNYWVYNKPYYDISNLNTYPNIDVTKWKGQQLMDAGQILFAEGTKLDMQRTMGFVSIQTYCVAPITMGDEPLASYDFWAVGMNCCDSLNHKYHCGAFNNPVARGGLRLMRDDERAFYRLAVQEAEAAYNIKATHPLFFSWVQDPIAEAAATEEDGMKHFLLGMFSFFVLQAFLVATMSLLFSKLGTD